MKDLRETRRETIQCELFGLAQSDKRGGVDAFLDNLPFELKSSRTGTHFSTCRDFGLSHVEKFWESHWVFSVFNDEDEHLYSYYAKPTDMHPWLRKIGDEVRRRENVIRLRTNATVYDDGGEFERLVQRAGTLNDPRIPIEYFADFPMIRSNAAAELRELVSGATPYRRQECGLPV
jgi:hypothetical protein